MNPGSLVHMPVDGPHRDLELFGQVNRSPAVLRHVTDLPDLLRGQFVIALRTFLEGGEILSGDQPIPADLDGRQSSSPNEGQHTLGGDPQDLTGFLSGEVIHRAQS